MKKYLKFDFDARVNGEILYPAGSVQAIDEGPSCQRWIQRGATEISEKEFKALKAEKKEAPAPTPPAPPAPPKAPEVKDPPKKDADTKEETDGL